MSFQGDVRGIGLAELLQGLARGRKEGTLTLSTKSGLHGTLGLLDGKAYLLADQGEEVETWRVRVHDAWAMRSDEQVDHLRTAEIARAERLENIYRLLDGEGVHFRFEPGDLPVEESGLGDPLSVEFLLLEYARVTDELEGSPAVRALAATCVPILLDAPSAEQAGCPKPVLQEVNGISTIQEIADRLAVPIRSARLALGPALLSGSMRIASAAEVLHFALEEIRRKRYTRGSVRLEHWSEYGPPGPVPQDVAERLADEWLSGRLTASLKAMRPQHRRCLLRRLDHSLRNPSQTVVHWLEATRIDRTDRIARLKRMAAEYKEGSNPERPGVRELLDLARELRDAGTPRRAAPLLVMAANLQPASMQLQMELGVGLLAAGRVDAAAPWIVAGAEELLDQGHADRALLPLRNLLEGDPRNRECRVLLARARRQSSSTRKMRRVLLASLGLVAVAGSGAAWKFHTDALNQQRLAEVRALVKNPEMARAKLDEYFGDSTALETRVLKNQIAEYERLIEEEMRDQWVRAFEEVKVECSRGEPAVALQRIRELPVPPRLKLLTVAWPEPRDLYVELAERMHLELEVLGPPADGAPQQVHAEKTLHGQAETVIVTLLAEERPSALRSMMVGRMEDLQEEIDRRREVRDELIAERVSAENLDRQDELFRLAEGHEDNGDYQRAEKCYEDILALDESGRVRNVLRDRIADVRAKRAAVDGARALALEGEHDAAIAMLEEVFDDISVFMLPYRVESYPAGARVETGSGRLYTTPFAIESTPGTEVEFAVTMPAFEPQSIRIDRPRDLLVYLSREPDRAWHANGRIDAVPVSIGDDHLIVSRHGEIARIGDNGSVRWSKRIKSLSGLARAPVFMPQRPGYLLAVTEDGEAWVLDGETGHLEGPWSLGAAPVVGPAPSAGSVAVRLADDRVVEWTDKLKPSVERIDLEEDFGGSYRFGSISGFQVARRRSGDPDRLDCRWIDWTISGEDDAYLVHPLERPDLGYSVLRSGDWEFIAWEAPSGRAPEGRVWISDEAGIRAFSPPAPRDPAAVRPR